MSHVLYRTLLHLYPSAFRAEYGGELIEVFEQRRRDVSGGFGLALLWLETIVDVLVTAAQVHLDMLWQDLRYTARTLRESPGFAVTAMLVAALGMGANTAVLTLVDHVLIRPLPYADADRLMKLWEDQSPQGFNANEPSPANYRDWKQMNHSFESMATYRGLSVNMAGIGDPERLEGASVTADLFPMLGARAAIGRTFSPDDDRAESAGTLLLSDGFWKRRFGADPGVLGKRVLLDGAPFMIVGVMPQGFSFPSRNAQIWTAMRFTASDFEDRTNNYLLVVGKLRQGVSIEQARAEMAVISAQLRQQYPKDNERVRVTITRLRDEISERSRLLLKVLIGGAICIFLIACMNLANLLLARALARRRELAVRAAMGAGRERLIRQLLTESLVLALGGAMLGVALAVASLPLLARLVPTSLPIAETPAIDWRLLSVATALAVLTGLGFGIVPALRACSGNLSGLREGARSGVGGRKERLRAALVIAEVTGSVVLLVSCCLLIRALVQIRSTDPGFRAENVMTLRTSLPMPKYERTARRVQFYDRVLAEIRGLPGVTGAGYISFLPIANPGGIWRVDVAGDSPETRRRASLRFVTPGFFETLNIQLLSGRNVSEADTMSTPLVAVVSESFARRYFPGQNALDREFNMAFGTRRIVGIVRDIRVRGLERTSEPQVYLPYRQVDDGNVIWYAPKDLVVRSTVDSATLVPALRQIIRNADPEQPVSDVRTLTDVVAADSAPRVVQVRVLGAFAAIAFLLAAVGIHGLLSFAVSQRTKEFGVRIALGAKSTDILSLVMSEGVYLSGIGIAAGVVLAYLAGRALETLLAGIRPTDPVSFGVTIALCGVMTVAGALLPAIRALRLDAAKVIRAD